MGTIRININNKEIITADDKNILQIALENNIEIPHLCYDERIKPYGACGLCVVEIEGSPKLQRACSTKPFDGMIIKTETNRIRETRKAAIKLLCSDHRGDCRPPCMLACPGKTDCQGYVGLIANGEYKEALKLTKENIPLPASIGRVCPHPCESACRRQLVEEPVSIAALKSFIADMDLEKNTYIPELKSSTGKKVAVIGAGPAGLSCAYYLAKEGHKVDIYEAMPKPGGMLRYGIPQYRLPKEVLDREVEVITRMGVNIEYNTKVGKDVSLEYLRKEYNSVFLGIGAWNSTKLGCTGDDSQGVLGGIDFLIRVASNEDVSIGKKVLVVGGGNTAMDVARTAVRLGAEEVTVLYRRTREEMPAEEIEIEEAEEEEVKFEFLAAPTEVVIEDGRTAGLKCQKMMLGEPDASGRRKPVPVPGEEIVFETDMIISAIGQKINSAGLNEVNTTKWGTLAVNEETYMTSVDGIFAGGDAVTGPGIAIAAIGHGRECADLINNYLNGVVKKSAEPLYVKQNDVAEEDLEDKPKTKRVTTKVVPAEIRKHNFGEINSILTEEEARKESQRCLECGCGDYFDCQLYKYINEYDVDPEDYKGERPKHKVTDEHNFITRNQDKCVLCGLCVRACDEIMGVEALGLVHRGFDSAVKPEFEYTLKDSDCISCGQCINVCPTGACMEKVSAEKQVPVKYDSYEGVCRYCSVGCKVRYDAKGETIFRAVPLNDGDGILCSRGKFGLRHINSDRRVFNNVIKAMDNKVLSDDESALHFVKKLQALNAAYGKDSIAFAVSPRFSNEELFMIRRIARKFNTDIIGSFTNFEKADLGNITGFDGSTNSYDELYSTDVILSFGAVAESHPILGIKVKNAAGKKAKLISVNKEKTSADEWAVASFKPENDLNFINKFIKSLVANKFISEDKVQFVSEVEEDETSIKLAKLYGEAKKAMIVVDEDTLSGDAIELLSKVAVLTGKIGMPHRGVIIARKKNNSQGLLDMGFSCSGKEILNKIQEGKVKGLVVFGEDPLGACQETLEIFEALDTLISFDCLTTDTTEKSDMLIAISSPEESAGSFTRTDRKVQFVNEGIRRIKEKSTLETLLNISRYSGMNVETIDVVRSLISEEICGYCELSSAAKEGKSFYTFGKNSLTNSELTKLNDNLYLKVSDNASMFIERRTFDSIERYWEEYMV